MKPWTKKDVKVLCGTVSTFWLYNRPLGNSAEEHTKKLDEVRQFLAQHRDEVIVAGLTELRNLSAQRADENQAAANHFAVHPEVYGKSTPEMIDRFSRLATDDRKDVAKANELIARIQTEGLPPEVRSFDPVEPSKK